MDRQDYFLRLSLVARNLASLQEVASACKAIGAVEVTVAITSPETSPPRSKCSKRTLLEKNPASRRWRKQLLNMEVRQLMFFRPCYLFEGLDVLVNNAGILLSADFSSVTMEEIDRSMQVTGRSATLQRYNSQPGEPEERPQAEPGEPPPSSGQQGKHCQCLQHFWA